MNDPNGSGEQYLIRTFRRVHDDEINGEAIEVKLQSLWNTQKTNTLTMLPTATISFNGHR
ncbi:hypothetical protein BCA37_25385 [Mycobacterium sp. djl-10]|nr:hypothetical protein BCA37_25385 [Mycobacterium sp. djl-10]